MLYVRIVFWALLLCASASRVNAQDFRVGDFLIMSGNQVLALAITNDGFTTFKGRINGFEAGLQIFRFSDMPAPQSKIIVHASCGDIDISQKIDIVYGSGANVSAGSSSFLCKDMGGGMVDLNILSDSRALGRYSKVSYVIPLRNTYMGYKDELTIKFDIDGSSKVLDLVARQ